MNKVPLIQKVYLLTDTDLINNIEIVYHKRYLYKTGCHINLLVYPSEDFLDVEKDKRVEKEGKPCTNIDWF